MASRLSLYARNHRSPPSVEDWNEQKLIASLGNSQDRAMLSVPEREQLLSDRLELVSFLERPADHIPDTVRRAETAISRAGALVHLRERPSDRSRQQNEPDSAHGHIPV